MPLSIDNVQKYINDILYGKRDLSQFNQAEHAGVCSAGAHLVGALIVCDFARESLASGRDAETGQGAPA